MLSTIRKCNSFALLAVLLAGNWIIAGAVWGYAIGRIMPSGKVVAYNGDQIVHQYTREAPFPEGLLLKTEGRCGVRLDDFYMVADDQTIFAVRHQNNQWVLQLEQGMLYFALASLPGKLAFQTPNGFFPAQHILILSAAASGVIKGYLEVKADNTEIGILEGGQMVVSTPDGDRQLSPGKQITIAQALIFDEGGGTGSEGAAEEEPQTGEEPQEQAEQVEQAEQDPETTAKKPRTGVYVAAGLATVAVIGGALALSGGGGGGGSGGGGGDDGNGSVSPID